MPKEAYWVGSEESFHEFMETSKQIRHLESLPKDQLPAKYAGYFDDDEDDEDEGRQFDHMVQVVDGLAVVSISGSLVNQDSWFNRMFGRVSYNEIRGAVLEAMEQEEVTSILLDIDSPGGSVNGLQETGQLLRQVDRLKPVYSHTSTMMASGGYWLGSYGRDITATELSQVGSIGVIMVHADYTEYFEKEGVKNTVLRKGKYKALLNPYEKLTKEAETLALQEMDVIYDVFTRTVAENRGLAQEFIKQNAAEGQVFTGAAAVNVGLVSSLSSYDDVVNTLIARHNTHKSDDITYGVQAMKKRTLTAAVQAALASGAPLTDIQQAEVDAVAKAEADAKVEADAAGEAAAGEAAAEPKVDDSAAAEGEAPPATPATVNDKADGSAAVIDRLMDKISALQDAKADMSLELKAAQQEATRAKVAESGLKDIAVIVTQRLQVALNIPPSKNLSSLSAEALVEQFQMLNADFCGQYKIGATAIVPTEGSVASDGSATQLEENAFSASKISKE